MWIPGSLLAAGFSPDQQRHLWKTHKKMPETLWQLGVVDVEQAVEGLKQHSDKAVKRLRCISHHARILPVLNHQAT